VHNSHDTGEKYLFGHVKGRVYRREYRFTREYSRARTRQHAILDEIAELTLEVQGKLFDPQDGVVQRNGNHSPRHVDVRIIAASNRDLRKEVSRKISRRPIFRP